MKVIGIDPGIANTGIAIVQYEKNRYSLLDSCHVQTPPSELTGQRLKAIATEIEKLVDVHVVDGMAIEKIYHNRNVKSSISTGMVIGISHLIAANRCIPFVFELTPQQVKRASGIGARIGKEQVLTMASRLLRTEIRNHHVADSALAGLAGLLKMRPAKSQVGKIPDLQTRPHRVFTYQLIANSLTLMLQGVTAMLSLIDCMPAVHENARANCVRKRCARPTLKITIDATRIHQDNRF